MNDEFSEFDGELEDDIPRRVYLCEQAAELFSAPVCPHPSRGPHIRTATSRTLLSAHTDSMRRSLVPPASG